MSFKSEFNKNMQSWCDRIQAIPNNCTQLHGGTSGATDYAIAVVCSAISAMFTCWFGDGR